LPIIIEGKIIMHPIKIWCKLEFERGRSADQRGRRKGISSCSKRDIYITGFRNLAMTQLGQSIALLLEHFWTWIFTMIGLSPTAGQIVHVLPTQAVKLAVRGIGAGKSSKAMGNGEKHTNGEAIKSNGHAGSEPLGKFILERCPSLKGSFNPSWWIKRCVILLCTRGLVHADVERDV
jgi:hypothetical protein